MDPQDEPLLESKAGIVQGVIKHELHTDDITRDAVSRLEVSPDTASTLPVIDRYGAEHARCTEDWVYEVNRRTVVPLRTGLSFSYNALTRGTMADGKALPNTLRWKLQGITEEIVKKRRKAAKARAKAKAAKECEKEEVPRPRRRLKKPEQVD